AVNRTVVVAGADVTGQDFTTPAWVISGTVTFQSSGTPAAFVTVGLSGSGSTASYFTQNDGKFSFLVPNGTYTITPNDLSPTTVFTTGSRTVTVTSEVVARMNL